MDADSLVALNGGVNAYGFHHRTYSHSIVGLVGVALVVLGMAWGASRVRRWRRFGWFVGDNLPHDAEPTRVPLHLLIWVVLSAVFLHWCGDVITGYGNMEPFWPWSQREVSLRAVPSFDWLIFLFTMGWHVLIRTEGWPRRREAPISALYLTAVICYILVRLKWFEMPIW